MGAAGGSAGATLGMAEAAEEEMIDVVLTVIDVEVSFFVSYSETHCTS